MAPSEQRLNPLVTDSPWASIIVTFGIILPGLYLLSEQPSSPFVFYAIEAGALLILLIGSDTEFFQLKQILGFNVNGLTGPRETAVLFLLFTAGVGLITAFFGLISAQAFQIFAGNRFIITNVFGLYPAAVSSYSQLYSEIGVSGTAVLMMIVATVETFQIKLYADNWSNYLFGEFGVDASTAYAAGLFLIAPLLWWATHYFSWTLTVASTLTFIFINFVFFLPFILADLAGIFSPEQAVVVKDVLTPGAIGAHAAWNTFTAATLTGVFGLESGVVVAGIGVGITVLSFAGMYIVMGRAGVLRAVQIQP